MHFKYTSQLNYFKVPKDEQGVKLSEDVELITGVFYKPKLQGDDKVFAF